MQKKRSFTKKILWLAVIIAVLATGAAMRDGKLLGHDLRATQDQAATTRQRGDTLSLQPDGGIVVNTKPLAKDVSGYGGPVPLRIHISNSGIVTKIEALPNSETPDFFDSAKELFARWQGKTVDQALAMKVDGVSGATFSSKAIIENMRRGLAYAKHDAEAAQASSAGAGWTVGGVAAPLVMVIVALAYPLAGKQGHYCAHMCPFGSAQELAGKLTRRKPRMSPRLSKALTTFRRVLWGVLMALMLTGTWTAWMDYELFTAFLYTSAPIAVTVIAALFLVLSVWVPRPYCRFVCPTGTLIRS